MGKLVIFSAPSGSGKTTIVRELLKRFSCFEFSISATSRKPRGEEKDGVDYYFYPACGRRRYNDGLVENMNSKEGVYPSQPQPWEGYYWTTSTTADGKAVALYFDLTTTRTINKFFPSHSARRANGFQIRCVKE